LTPEKIAEIAAYCTCTSRQTLNQQWGKMALRQISWIPWLWATVKKSSSRWKLCSDMERPQQGMQAAPLGWWPTDREGEERTRKKTFEQLSQAQIPNA